MNATYWLSKNLKEAFSITGEAHDWVMALWNAIQVFDDMADGDFPERENLSAEYGSAVAVSCDGNSQMESGG